MLILWLRKNKKKLQANPVKNVEGSFQKHNEEMKRFRELHQELETIISKDIITTDGTVLAPIDRVKLAKNSQN